MYKNQLQELAQRSCFNLPSYACIREGPDHAPRFKASVNFNGEIFDSPSYCTTLRQAEHAAAEVALNVLSTRGPARSLTARVLDETGVYKNLLQETAHRAGLNLPVYTTVRSGPGHVPIFTCTVELAGMNFTGEPAKTKKQAEKNAAIAAWSSLKKLPNLGSLTNKEADAGEDQDQTAVARVLSDFRPKDEGKQVRRRDQNQAKRRMVRTTHRDVNCGSSSTSSNLLQHNRQWRLMDLFMDFVPEGPSKKQNSFVSLLPPLPPRTTSKILPPTSPNRHIPVNVRGRSQIITPPLEEHQKDEEEWLGGKKEGPSNSSSIYRQFPLSNNGNVTASSLLDRSRRLGSQDSSQFMYSGGFHGHRIAPAVQIRSVIPVCAAPPPPPPMKETSPLAALTASPSTSMSTHTGEKVSSATQLSSEFNKLKL
ncbi:double-stranded RNA-binding protein 3 isoform X3 [Alnus glutinosa]|nr:double-stranded RNA-binding protein 3 isoform X3 [Alnus glutinosa]